MIYIAHKSVLYKYHTSPTLIRRKDMQCAIHYRKGRYRQYVCHVLLHHNLNITQEPVSQLNLGLEVTSWRPWRRRVTVRVARVKSEGLSAMQSKDVDSSTQGEGKEGEENIITNTATQPSPIQHSKTQVTPNL